MNNKILFHGSKEVVKIPEIRPAKYNKDFYYGFYCTLLENQAARWATRFTGHGIISKYQYTESSNQTVEFSDTSDFFVNGKYTIECGGKSKTGEQIKSLKNAFVAADGIEAGSGSKIPLWLFGFLY